MALGSFFHFGRKPCVWEPGHCCRGVITRQLQLASARLSAGARSGRQPRVAVGRLRVTGPVQPLCFRQLGAVSEGMGLAEVLGAALRGTSLWSEQNPVGTDFFRGLLRPLGPFQPQETKTHPGYEPRQAGLSRLCCNTDHLILRCVSRFQLHTHHPAALHPPTCTRPLG